MSGLADFIAARLGEDEAMAKAAQQTTMANGPLADQAGPCISDEGYAYIIRFRPARVLREVTAKRAMVAMHRPEVPKYGKPLPRCTTCLSGRGSWQEDWQADPWPCETLRAMATAWSDHPDYRAEWQPAL